MTINTAASIGDKIWTQYHSVPLTIGQIRVCLTDSKGINGGDPEGTGVKFHNYMPQKEYVEEYMCEETGIGSGSVYTLGKSAFLTKDEMEKAKANLGKIPQPPQMTTTIERRRIPTDAQMQNWLDARVNEIASTYGRDGDLLPYKAGVLEGQLIVCLIDPDKIERLRAEILSFPEERQ